MKFFIPLFFVATTALDFASQQNLFSTALADVTPGDLENHITELHTLIGLGEDSRAVAIHNQSVAQGIFDTANSNWQTAFDEEQSALGDQKEAEEAEAAAVVARDNAIDFKNQRILEKAAADALVPPAKQFMEDEIARVDTEKAALEKVKGILESLVAPSEIQMSTVRKLLSKSGRTAAFFTNPSFLESLNTADPAAVQQVLDIVVNLLQEGEDDRNFAIGEYNDRVAEAAVAAQNLADAEASLAARESELLEATAHREEMTTIAQGKTAVEVEKRAVRDEKHEKLDIQIAFTNREIARIDGEKSILEEDRDLIELTKKIAELLA